MGAAAVIIAGIIGAGASIAGSVISSKQQEKATGKAAKEARKLQGLARSDELKQLNIQNEQARQQMAMQKQQLGLSSMALGMQDRHWKTEQNKVDMQTALAAIGNAATKNANFKNYILSRFRY